MTAHLALVGTTASGKSALAFEVARRLGDVELVSVDSMQVYRGMDIGTAKASPAERHEIPHHLIDLAEPDEDFSVTRFQAAAAEAIDSIESRGHRALLVGGTGLYHRAIIDDLDVPPQWPAVRAAVDAEPDTTALHGRLRELDPTAATRMEPTNRRRIVRALEVTIGSGRPFSSFGPGLGSHNPTHFNQVGVWLPRAVVATRIEARLRAMIDGGLLDEVARLRPSMGRTARQALGYREFIDHLDGALTFDEALVTATRRTQSFAKRQRAWFRRDPRITWYGADANPFAVLPALLGEWA